jgi:hypothetical protein
MSQCGYKESDKSPVNQNINNTFVYKENMVGLHRNKRKDLTKENFCGTAIDQYGEERSVKDIQMLKQFGCRS